MSTSGPDPNGPVPPDHDTARGDFGNSSVSRLGMPSLLTGLVVLLIAVGVLLVMIF
jgi:hypothetical protein